MRCRCKSLKGRSETRARSHTNIKHITRVHVGRTGYREGPSREPISIRAASRHEQNYAICVCYADSV